jgi:hypothetical protein
VAKAAESGLNFRRRFHRLIATTALLSLVTGFCSQYRAHSAISLRRLSNRSVRL